MTTPDNRDQIAYWNSDAAARWVAQQEEMDPLLAPFGRAALDALAVKRGERVLDVGCGCGGTTLDLAAMVGPEGAVVGVDVSAPMLARARVRAAHLPNVSFLEGDAAAARFDAPFDAVFSRFGVMFFVDPVAAFANIRRALRPGGRLAFACWRAPAENPFMQLPFLAAATVVPPPPPPPPDAPGPFAFADAARVRGILESAGFESIAIGKFDTQQALPDDLDEAANFAVRMGPAARLLETADEAARARARAATRDALAAQPKGSDGRRALAAANWIVTARCP